MRSRIKGTKLSRNRKQRIIRRNYKKSKHSLRKKNRTNRNRQYRKKRGGSINNINFDWEKTPPVYDDILGAALLAAGKKTPPVYDDVLSAALLTACDKNDVNAVEQLLTKDGIDVNYSDTKVASGFTPLFMACYKGHIKIVALLLAHKKIEVNKPSIKHSATPLYGACYKGHVEIVKMLLAKDEIEVNTQMLNGATPILAAASYGYTQIIEALLIKGADPSLPTRWINNIEKTPLQFAMEKNYTDVVVLLWKNMTPPQQKKERPKTIKKAIELLQKEKDRQRLRNISQPYRPQTRRQYTGV